MKQLLILLLIAALNNTVFGQGLTSNGQNTSDDTKFVNSNGAIGANLLVNKNGKIVETLVLFQNYQGGKIFYFLKVGDPGYVEGERHGLIAAVNLLGDAWKQDIWTTTGVITNATGNAIGAGANNTALIVANDPNAVAAKQCDDLSITSNNVVYDDWYLPSRAELVLLSNVYTNINNSWNNGTYWSSTEESATSASGIRFFDTGYYSLGKQYRYFVVAIRKF